jgi:hypothetical protein
MLMTLNEADADAAAADEGADLGALSSRLSRG